MRGVEDSAKKRQKGEGRGDRRREGTYNKLEREDSAESETQGRRGQAKKTRRAGDGRKTVEESRRRRGQRNG